MALFNPLSNAFGLDIGDRTFKIVQISRKTGVKRSYRLRAWGSVNVPEGVMERGEIMDQPAAVERLRKLISQMHGRLKGRAVVASLPEAKSFVKILEIEKNATPEQRRKAVDQEIEQNIPLPLDEIYYDWQVLPERPVPPPAAAPPVAPPPAVAAETPATPDAAAPPAETLAEEHPEDGPEPEAAPQEPRRDMTRILLGAAPKRLVDSYVQMLEAAGLAPIALEIESAAIARAVIPEQAVLNEPAGILDIGATRSSLVIMDEDALQMSISIPLSGNELTQIISEKLAVSIDDAEVIKVECGLDAHRCEDRMWRILLPLIDDMCSKIRNALRFYKIGFPTGKKIERLYLCGGGAHFRDIDSVLSRKLTIKVSRGDALVNVAGVPKHFPQANSLAYATAIGLALRAAEEIKRYRSSFRA